MKIALVLAASGILAAAPAARAQAPAAPASTDTMSLLQSAATKARLVAARIEAQAPPEARSGRAPRPDPAMAPYLEAVAQMGRGQFDSALVRLRAAAMVNQNSARYRGDLGYALAAMQRWEEAGTEYAAAARLQSANPWYFVGLAVVRANEQHWVEAGANFELARSTDSTILDPVLIAAASFVFERGGDEQQLFEWSRAGTQLFPNEAAPWLRLATLLRSRASRDTGRLAAQDSTEGLAAIRRYRTLQPDDRLGAAVFALYLYDIAQYDSAVTFAQQAAADSTLREYASMVYLRSGARLLQAHEYERAARVLTAGRAIASQQSHARYSFYIAHSNIHRLAPMYTDAVQKKDCAGGHAVDSLLVSVDHDFRESVALDSAQTTQILTQVLPQFRTRVDEFLATCRGR